MCAGVLTSVQRSFRNVDGVFGIRDITNGANRLTIDSNGVVDVAGNTNFGAGIDVTGNATVSGNLSVGGVLTYEDVTNVDSVGVITARSGIRIGATGANTLITGNGTGIGIGINYFCFSIRLLLFFQIVLDLGKMRVHPNRMKAAIGSAPTRR
mgnify:CR=1 FL=1